MISTDANNENGPPQSGEKCDRQNDDRLNIIKKYMLLSTKVKGTHQCRWCQEDETIQSDTVYDGHAEIVRHLVMSLKSSDYVVNGSKLSRNGMHTETAKLRRHVQSSDFGSLDMSNPKCPYPDCHKSWTKISRGGFNQHIASKHSVQNLNQQEAFEGVKAYLKQHHDVEFSKAQFDMVLLKSNEKKRTATQSSSS
jgi:hypothetical protein